MNLVEMKVAAITKITTLNDHKELLEILKLLSQFSLAKKNNPADKTQHYQIAKKRHEEILKEL